MPTLVILLIHACHCCFRCRRCYPQQQRQLLSLSFRAVSPAFDSQSNYTCTGRRLLPPSPVAKLTSHRGREGSAGGRLDALVSHEKPLCRGPGKGIAAEGMASLLRLFTGHTMREGEAGWVDAGGEAEAARHAMPGQTVCEIGFDCLLVISPAVLPQFSPTTSAYTQCTWMSRECRLTVAGRKPVLQLQSSEMKARSFAGACDMASTC